MLGTASWTAAWLLLETIWQGKVYHGGPDKHGVHRSPPWRVCKGGQRLEGVQGSQGLHGCPEGRVQGGERAHEARPGLLRGQLQPLRGLLQLCHGCLHLRGPEAMHLLGCGHPLPVLQAELSIEDL